MEKWIIVLALVIGCLVLIKIYRSYKSNKFGTLIGEIKGALIFGLSELTLPRIENVMDFTRYRLKRKIIVIFQPYDHKVLSDQYDKLCRGFDLAEKIVITKAYDEKLVPHAKKTVDDLYRSLQSHGKDVAFASNQHEIKDILQGTAITDNYMIFFIGTGSIPQWACELVRYFR